MEYLVGVRIKSILSLCLSMMLLLIKALKSTKAFGIAQPTRGIGAFKTTKLQAIPLTSTCSGSCLWISDNAGIEIQDIASAVSDSALAATASSSDAAFSDQIDFFGDPTIRTLFIVFGGVVVLLAALSALSKQVDAAIGNVVDDFEFVLSNNPEFRSNWEEIEAQLKVYDNEVDKVAMRKQKLFEFMEEMEQTEPELMKKISAKMDTRSNNDTNKMYK
mmetsp:Transcript_8173/g.18976  ORF Transcript_8173/g.18976 Transcript_8173/m.18976 type:complete len:218 (-) Transcript_8173:31-684(-)